MSGESPPAGSPRSVFCSYSRAERAKAIPLIDALRAGGLTVWWDGLLKGGERFAKTTETALETSDVVLVLWSAVSVESHWVRDEATRGRDRGCMVSVSLDGTEPPLGFRQIQYIDLSGWRGDPADPVFAELLEAITLVAEAPGSDLSFGRPAAPAAKVSRRALLVASGAGVVALAGGAALWRAGMFGTPASANSIAVMPFENLSGDPEQAYFSDGLTEELRATLSLNPQLEVMAQTTSEKLRDEAADAMAVAARLNVANVLQGSVRRSGERLRIVATLVDGKNGFEKWSEVFERAFDDVLAVQSAIATEAVDALLANLDKDTAQTERIGGTDDPRALDAFLRGKALYDLARDEASDRAALAAFGKAVALDPGYAAAHAALSRVNTFIASSYVGGREMQGYFARALASARRAAQLAPDLAEGHSALGFALVNGKLDLAAARMPYETSFKLGFGNAPILTNYAIYASTIDDRAGAAKAVERAERIDPLNASTFRTSALVNFAGRDMAATQRAARTALTLNPEINTVHRVLGDMAVLQADWQRAAGFYRKEPNSLSRLRGLAIVEHKLGDVARADAALADLVAEFGDNSLYQQAQVRAQWGEADRALAALEKGFDAGDSGMVLMLTDPLLDPIRQHPRFAALLDRLGVSPGDPSMQQGANS
jgi:TolB-like protein